jgi:predicted ribosomally synthesized peptide with SipW-like signal peptide
MSTEHNPEDYVLVHRSKAKISRARKIVIGFMALGAVTAMASAGTFASFSATTTNDASFKTGRLVLSNTKQSGTSCFSSGTGVNGAEGDSVLDDNETTCDALFANNLKPGTTATAGVQLTNGSTGDYTGVLSLYSNSTCTNEKNDTGENAGSADLCGAVELYIQEVDSTYATPTSSCVFPFSAGSACNTSFTAGSDFISDFMSASGTFATRDTVAASLATGASKYFLVALKLGSAGGFSSTGVGLDNKYMNKKANLLLTWHLTEA